MHVWLVAISMGSLLLVIVVGTTMLIVGIVIGIHYQRKKGPRSLMMRPASLPREMSKDYELDLQTSAATSPLYDDLVTVVGENNRIELSNNVSYGHISHR